MENLLLLWVVWRAALTAALTVSGLLGSGDSMGILGHVNIRRREGSIEEEETWFLE